MPNIYPFSEIDIVLSIFKPEFGKLEVGETKKTIKHKLLNDKHISIEERLLDEILDKLENDKYLRSVSDGHIIRNGENFKADPKIYTITLIGEIFLLSGGFVGEIQRQTNPLRKLKTGLINVAALTAGAYYFFEIVRLYIVPIWQHVCHCEFVWQN